MDIYGFKKIKHSATSKSIWLFLILILTFGICYATDELTGSPSNILQKSVTVQQANEGGSPFTQPAGFLIQDIQVRRVNVNNTDIKLIFANKPVFKYFVLKKPARLVVDIEQGQLKRPIRPEVFNDTLIKGLRQEKQPNQVLRLVFDMKSDLSVIQSVIDPKVVVFKLKSKNAAPSSVSPVPAVVSKSSETAAATNIPISSDTAAASKGMSTAVQQDSLLLVVGQIKSFFGFNDKQAVALELDGGPRVLRGNGTYAYALNDNNRVKLTAEYLRENLDFEFYTGDTRQWVQQGAVGAAYEYLLGDNIFKNINVGGHYSHAQSKDLSTQTIAYPDGSTITDFRRLAGGNDLNGNAEAGMKLWKDGVVTAGPDYDRVRYDTKYEIQDGRNARGFGGHVRLDQKLKNNLGLQLYSTVSQLFDTYGAGLNWAWSSKDNTVWSAGLTSSYTQDFTTERNFWVNGLNVSVAWDVPQTKSAALNQNSSSGVVESLAQWVQTPAVRMPDVLAISDERIIQVGPAVNPFVPIAGFCPIIPEYNPATGQYSASGGWYQSYLQGPVSDNQLVAFDSANVMGNPSGAMDCLYRVYDLNGQLLPQDMILINNTYTNVTFTNGPWSSGQSQHWPNIGTSPTYFCFGNPSDCTFATAPPPQAASKNDSQVKSIGAIKDE